MVIKMAHTPISDGSNPFLVSSMVTNKPDKGTESFCSPPKKAECIQPSYFLFAVDMYA